MTSEGLRMIVREGGVIMCDVNNGERNGAGLKTIPVCDAVGMVLAHDITEIRKDEFKGRAFKKGHIVTEKDICHLQRLGKESLYVLGIAPDEMHEDDAAYAMASALAGEGVKLSGEPVEGKINLIAARDGLLMVDKERLLQFNMLGDVMCATMHNNSVVRSGQVVAGTRAIPLVVKRKVVEEAVAIAKGVRRMQDAGCKIPDVGYNPSLSPLDKGGIEGGYHQTSCIRHQASGIIEVKKLRRPKAGVVITGNEIYYGRIKDSFAPIITKKIEAFHGEIVGIYYAPDDESFIEERLKELIEAGADLLITTGGMSVDPDDVTRFAIKKLGATDITYGSAVLPGAMFLVAYLQKTVESRQSVVSSQRNSSDPRLSTNDYRLIPILGIPACGMYHKTTIFDLILPRVLAGAKIGRGELAELGHGGLCLNCKECRYPVCSFGKGV
jgi:molybdopterin biosynthesis enzyme MoaB